MTEFAELCAKTNFSLLEGASRPEEMVARSRELGLSAIGIADRGGLYGSVRAHVEAEKRGQRLIVGAEIDIAPRAARPEHRAASVATGRATLLVLSEQGYHNLCRILTAAHADLPRERAVADPETLAEHASGLFAILDVPLHERAELVHEDACLGLLSDAFGSRAYLASVRRFTLDDDARERALEERSRRFGVPLVATARPLYHAPGRKMVADVLACIRKKTTLDRAGDHLAPNAEAYLHSAAQMARLFRHAPERVARTVEIANACTFSLSQIRYTFPCDDVLPGETPDQALARLVAVGTRERYPEGTPPAVERQLLLELDLIARLGVAQFFLSVYDIVRIARELRILCQGRGSAANSAVCYVLGITAVDPARSSLLFERFLSAERNEPPDIDVDFEHERREEVIQAIYAKYGRDRAAMVSEVITYRGKSALRETSKAFGLSQGQADTLAGAIGPYDPIENGDKLVRAAGLDPLDRRLQLVIDVASQIQGFPRHMSTHVGGFVLSARPIHEVSPVEPAKIPGRTVVPWDKDDIDALGFFKVDVLGLGMLTAIRKALALVHEGDGFDPIASLVAIPAEDPAVYDAVCKADTVGVFQIESRAQMAMLPRLRPRTFYDLVVEVAIVRPGPIQGGMVHPYLRRRNGEEPPTMPHPSLRPILDRTLGVPIFQEQVMQIAMTGAGYTAGEADELRRDMAAWRRHGGLARHEQKLLSGFRARGISDEFASKLFQQVQGFAEYGFPESHAASFALLVYASAWLKVHHPAELACALLNSQPMGFYAVSTLVRDAQKHGVVVLSPDVCASLWDSTIEDEKLRLGLRLVKGIGEEPAARIVRAREQAPLRDVKDLSVRAELRVDQVEALGEGGALESIVCERRQAIWQARAPDTGELFEPAPPNEPEVVLPELPDVDKLRLDYGRLGLSVSDHPMKHLRAQLHRRKVVTADRLADVKDGASVRVAGVVLSRQRPATASGIVFVTLEDETGIVNLVLRPHVFDKFRAVAIGARLMFVQGKLERAPKGPLFERNGEVTPVIHVLVSQIEELALAASGGRAEPDELLARSRDFH